MYPMHVGPPDTIPVEWAVPAAVIAWGVLIVTLSIEKSKRSKGKN